MPKTSVHRACDDFHRTTDARRQGFLGAGLTRRQVVARGVAGGLAVYAANAMSLDRVLEVASADAAAAPNAPVLVSVFLPGGCDLLSTLPPLAQLGPYADLRGDLRLRDPLALGATGLGAHPALARGAGGGIVGMLERGRIGLLPGIDYANPDLSHFKSRHFWETGLVTLKQAPGWLGRWLDRHGSGANPLQGISSGYDMSPVLRSARAPVAAVASPNDAQFWWRDTWGESADAAQALWEQVSAGQGPTPAIDAARTASRLAHDVARKLAPYRAEDDKPDPLAGPVAYPKDNELGGRLRNLAAMLALPLGTRVATVAADGDFDTHDNQPEELAEALGQVSEALSAFQADLEGRGIADRVLTFVWSEFGRRPEPNESNGTDHGAGGIAWVQGTRVRGGVLSEYPDLTKLDEHDNLAVTVDFRRVYSSLMEQWLGTDAAAVIPNAGAFGRVQLVS